MTEGTAYCFDQDEAIAEHMLGAVSQRRLRERRRMLLLQAVSYVFGDCVLWIYSYAGTVSATVPLLFVFSGILLTAFFALLSETGAGIEFRDHFLTTPQAATNILLQLAFVLYAPEIGITFLCVVFVIFGFASLRMTAIEAAILWALTGVGVAAILHWLEGPIALPTTSTPECAAAVLLFVVTIGQCAYIGRFGNSMRTTLRKRSVELRAAYKRIEELAQTDELTGLPNRRSIVKILEEEIARGHRGTPCSIAVIDLDWFKRINDNFGHQAGDEVLKSFAVSMFENMRENDRLGRYGGEEFLLVLPGTKKCEAEQMLERLRKTIEMLNWSALADQLTVTISVGLATFSQHDSPESILARADRALYGAKENGRNRIMSA